MLSVLIPTYRYNVSHLVHDLLVQLETSGLEWEIRVYDDASPDNFTDWGATLAQLHQNITVLQLPENLGRARIRNRLARESEFPNLLFLDADGAVPEQFIVNYRPFINQGKVVVGGRNYGPEAEVLPDNYLHWIYGRQREAKAAKKRQLTPYLGFQTNNFLAPRDLLLEHPFSEEAHVYGHEDTLWGQQLEELGQEIIHINNPVIHLGLEHFEVFLKKQEEAVANLCLLENFHPQLATRLNQFAKKAAWGRGILSPTLAWLAPLLKEQLATDVPGSLYYLDALKLYWYYSYKAQNAIQKPKIEAPVE